MAHVLRRVGLAMVVCMAGLVLGVGGCRKGVDASEVTTPAGPPTKTQRDVQVADSEFGFKLLQQLRAAGPPSNVFISPTSIALALDMTLAGAAGETQTAMIKALSLTGVSPGDVDQANLALRNALADPDKEVKLSIANSLWLRKGIDFVRSFLDIGTKFYGAKLSTVDFDSDRAAKAINGWVKDNTGGKIPEIVPVRPMTNTVCVLVNAVYFVGRWTDVFDKSQTSPHPFTFLDGTKKDLEMMTRSGEYKYLEEPGFQAIRLPYGKKRLAMYIFLPDKASSVAAFCKTLSAADWGKWMAGLQESEGKITLPRFRTEYSVKLNDALKAMGMGVAFEQGKGDFSKMCGTPGAVWIDEVLHKTFLEVDEEGTKAAAATSVGMTMAGKPGMPRKPFDMIVDRPFFCAIVDETTNAILFLGTIVSPEAPQGS